MSDSFLSLPLPDSESTQADSSAKRQQGDADTESRKLHTVKRNVRKITKFNRNLRFILSVKTVFNILYYFYTTL